MRKTNFDLRLQEVKASSFVSNGVTAAVCAIEEIFLGTPLGAFCFIVVIQ